MRTYNGYDVVSVGDIPMKKLVKAAKTGKLTLSKNELTGTRKMLVHPSNYKLIQKAKKTNKGINSMPISGGEIVNDVEWHDSMGGGVNGGSLWSWIKNKAVPWIKKNWEPIIKPVLSTVADTVAPMLGPKGVAARATVKSLTGIGVSDKRLAALAKAREARAKKKCGGSFLIN